MLVTVIMTLISFFFFMVGLVGASENENRVEDVNWVYGEVKSAPEGGSEKQSAYFALRSYLIEDNDVANYRGCKDSNNICDKCDSASTPTIALLSAGALFALVAFFLSAVRYSRNTTNMKIVGTVFTFVSFLLALIASFIFSPCADAVFDDINKSHYGFGFVISVVGWIIMFICFMLHLFLRTKDHKPPVHPEVVTPQPIPAPRDDNAAANKAAREAAERDAAEKAAREADAKAKKEAAEARASEQAAREAAAKADKEAAEAAAAEQAAREAKANAKHEVAEAKAAKTAIDEANTEAEKKAAKEAAEREAAEAAAARLAAEEAKKLAEKEAAEAAAAKQAAREAEEQAAREVAEAIAAKQAAGDAEERAAKEAAEAAAAEKAVQEAAARRAQEQAAREAAEKAAAEEAAKQAAEQARREAAAAKEAAKQKAIADRMAVLDRLEDNMREEIDFEKNQDTITEASKQVCDKIATTLLEYPELVIHIESHTSCKAGRCDDGCRLMELSQERVEEVMRYFQTKGCTNKFIPKGWGCKHPEIGNERKVRVFPEDVDHDI
jgi:outer membrane protein OmpA-like peptidoglycan-associated protein/cell division protein FtsN